MENTSALQSGRNITENEDLEFWIFTGINVPVTLAALYVCITQIIFCIKKAKLSRKFKRKHRNSDETARGKYGTLLNIMSALGTLGAFLRAAVDFRLIYGRDSDFGCDLTAKFKISNYTLTFTSIYLVLWLRQRVFYEHPGLRHLSSKLVRFVSWAMVIGIFLAIVGASGIFFAQGKYYGTPQGCAIPTGPLVVVRWVFVMVCTAIFQTCLLALFMYPLIKHRSMAYAQTRATEGGRNTIIRLVRRATVTSLSCVLSDVCFAFLVIGIARETMAFETFFYDFNAVFNAFCMVMSFGDWRTRLMPWRLREGAVNVERDLSSQDHYSRTIRTSVSVSTPMTE